MYIDSQAVGAFLLAVFVVQALLFVLVVAIAAWVYRATHRRMAARGARAPALVATGAMLAWLAIPLVVLLRLL